MNTLESKPIHQTFEHLRFSLDVLSMTKAEKLDWLSNHALALEHKYLREVHGLPQIAPEAKLQFLTGGKFNDVTKATDFEGRPIHTRYLTNPKDPSPKLGEIPEALGAINDWFETNNDHQERHIPPPSKIGPLNEVIDIIYCLANMVSLDKSAAPGYILYMEEIAKSLGMPLDTVFTLTIIKYNFRFGQGKSQKNHTQEDQILASFINNAKKSDGTPYIPQLSKEHLHSTFHTISGIGNLLIHRVKDLKQLYELGISIREQRSLPGH